MRKSHRDPIIWRGKDEASSRCDPLRTTCSHRLYLLACKKYHHDEKQVVCQKWTAAIQFHHGEGTRFHIFWVSCWFKLKSCLRDSASMVCYAGFASGGLRSQASIRVLSGKYQGYPRKGVYRHLVNLIPRGPQTAAILEPVGAFQERTEQVIGHPQRGLCIFRGTLLAFEGQLLWHLPYRLISWVVVIFYTRSHNQCAAIHHGRPPRGHLSTIAEQTAAGDCLPGVGKQEWRMWQIFGRTVRKSNFVALAWRFFFFQIYP